jgi:hypothetical protein
MEASSKWWTTATMDFAAARRSLSPPKVEPPKRSEIDLKIPLAGARGKSRAASSAIAATRSAPMLSLSQYQARIRERKQKGTSGLGWEVLAPESPLPLPTFTATESRPVKSKVSTRSRDPISGTEKKPPEQDTSVMNEVIPPLSDDDFINQALESRSLTHSVLSTPYSRRASFQEPSVLDQLSASVLVTRAYTPSTRTSKSRQKSFDENALEIPSSIFGEGSNVLVPYQEGSGSSVLPSTGEGSIVTLGIDKGFSVDRGFGLGGSKTNALGQGGGGLSNRLYHSVIGGSNLKSRRGGASSSHRLKPIVRAPPRMRGQPGIQMEMSVAKISLTSPPKNKK